MTNIFKKSLFVGLGVLCVAAITPKTFAQIGYSTDFNQGTFGPPGTLSQVDGWVTSDPSAGQNDEFEFIGENNFVGPITPAFAGYEASLGGRGVSVPGSDPIYLYRPFTTFSLGTTLTFDTDFVFSPSDVDHPARDTFAWTFRNGSLNLGQLKFTPGDALNNPNDLNLSFDSGAAFASVSYGLKAGGLGYHLKVVIDGTGLVTVTVDSTTYAPIATTIVTSAVDNVAATQILSNSANESDSGGATYKGGAGSNQMIFDNYAVVPEPSSIAMISMAGVGGLIVMAKRRKLLRK